MRFNKLLASMVVLGLASSSAFAQEPTEATRAELAALKARLAKMEAILDQNQAGVLQRDPEMARDWFQRVTVSGQIDAQAWVSNYSRDRRNKKTSYGIELPSANLHVDAQINRWAKAHMTLHYYGEDNHSKKDDKSRKKSHDKTGLKVDEAYVTLGNFADWPVYARIGQQYLPFGDYTRYPITPSLTQLLTQTRAIAAQVGFVMENGLHGAVYAYNGRAKSDETSEKIRSFGANVGFANSYNNVSYKLGVGYLNNMADVDHITTLVKNFSKRIGAVSVDGKATFNAFDVSAHYVTALKDFEELGKVKPAAASIEAGYSFPVVEHETRASISYQRSWKAARLGMARDRYVAQYDIELSKNIDLGIQVLHDRNYKVADGGDGRNSTTGVLRVSAKFA